MNLAHRLLFGVALAASFCTGAWGASWQVLLLEPADDPALDRTRLERAYLGQPGGSAESGLKVALEESQFELDAGKHAVQLRVERFQNAEAAADAARKAEKSGVKAVVTNLPASWTGSLASAFKGPIINVGAAAGALRGPGCAANLFHTIPSERMRTDALAQALAARRWQQILLLTGPSLEDAERGLEAAASIRRFGLKLVAQKAFKLSSDPRERAQADVALLTGNLAYDAVWVVDSNGEFSRLVPFNTSLPRPVVGDGGLVALGWHHQFERYGAPQVARRFAKAAKRPMTSQDWAAWMAGKAIVAALVAAPQGDANALQKALLAADLDGSKGVALQFRPWDRQLRQPMLITDGQGVLATLPVDGVLHPRNSLDTLGADESEKLCKAKT